MAKNPRIMEWMFRCEVLVFSDFWYVSCRVYFSWYQVWGHLNAWQNQAKVPHSCQSIFTLHLYQSLARGFSCDWTLWKWGSHNTERGPVQVNTVSVFKFRALSFIGGVGEVRQSFALLPPHPTHLLWELWMCLCVNSWASVLDNNSWLDVEECTFS